MPLWAALRPSLGALAAALCSPVIRPPPNRPREARRAMCGGGRADRRSVRGGSPKSAYECKRAADIGAAHSKRPVFVKVSANPFRADRVGDHLDGPKIVDSR